MVTIHFSAEIWNSSCHGLPGCLYCSEVSSCWVCENSSKISCLWPILWRNLWCLDCVGPEIDDKCPLVCFCCCVMSCLAQCMHTSFICKQLKMMSQIIQPRPVLYCSSSVMHPITSLWVVHRGWCTQCCPMITTYAFLCSFLAIAEVPCPVEPSAACRCYPPTMADYR